MFTDLPRDIQENIFQRLKPEDRIKMKLALPKTSNLYNKNKDKKLAVVSNYFKKNRTNILNKKEYISPLIIEFMNKYKTDHLVQKYRDEFGIKDKIDPDNCDIVIAINNNLFSEDIEYKWSNPCNIIKAFYIKGTPQLFIKLYNNKSIKDHFIAYLKSYMDSILFNIIVYENDDLINFIIHGDYEFKNILQEYIDSSIIWNSESNILTIFYTKKQTQMVLKYFQISSDTLSKMIANAENNLNVDTWEFLMNYKKTITNIKEKT